MFDLLLLKSIFEWIKTNREGFWQGIFVLLGFATLWMASKVVGKGKVIAGGVLDTYSKMTEDLRSNIDSERKDMAARITTLREELEEYRKEKEQADDAARKERESKLTLLTQLAAIKEALAREGEVVVQNPDGSVTIKHAGSIPTLKDL